MTTALHPLSADQLAALAHEANDCTPVFIDAMAQELADGKRAPARFADIAGRYRTTDPVVRRIAEAIDGGLIFESAPSERTTMPTATSRAEAIANVAKIHGAGGPTVAAIQRLLGVTESDATVMARRLVGESGETTPTPSPVDVRRTERAQMFADAVNAAEAKPIEKASLTDLENLAASKAWF